MSNQGEAPVVFKNGVGVWRTIAIAAITALLAVCGAFGTSMLSDRGNVKKNELVTLISPVLTAATTDLIHKDDLPDVLAAHIHYPWADDRGTVMATLKALGDHADDREVHEGDSRKRARIREELGVALGPIRRDLDLIVSALVQDGVNARAGGDEK